VSHSLSGTILLVVSMENKQNIQSLRDDWVWSDFLVPVIIQHRQEVLHVPQFVIRLVEVPPNSESISVRTNSRNGPDNSVDLFVNQTFIFVNISSG